MRSMHLIVAAASVLFLGVAIVACSNSAAREQAPRKEERARLVERGRYLVEGIGCDDCHSPKRMGPNGPELIPELRFSGYPADRPVTPPDGGDMKKGYVLMGADLTSAVGPWGISFAANISSDPTGIGEWSEAQFLTAIRQGKSKGLANNRPLLPPMPWFAYRNLSDEDLKAIFAYLKSTKPVSNVVPAPMPPQPI